MLRHLFRIKTLSSDMIFCGIIDKIPQDIVYLPHICSVCNGTGIEEMSIWNE